MSTLTQATARMVEDFSQGIRDLETLSLLLGDANRDEILHSLSQELCRAELMLDELERQVDEDVALTTKAQMVTARLVQGKHRARALERLLPTNNDAEADGTGGGEEDDNTLVVLAKAAAMDLSVNQISLPVQHEFDQRVPRYMKTLTFDQFHRICVFVNAAAEEKRRILFTTSSSQLDFSMQRRVQDWKQQSTPELAKLMFVTEEDVLGVMDAKTTAMELRAGLECLRHLGVLRVSPTTADVKRYVFLK